MPGHPVIGLRVVHACAPQGLFLILVLTWSLGALTFGAFALGTFGRGFAGRRLDFDLGVVRQAVGAACNHLVVLGDAVDNLHIVTLANADLHGFQVGFTIRAR